MNGGIFSAMGFAKNSLKHFKQAVALEPQNTDYLQALMSYYLAAPSFVGGDKSLALTIAKQINHLDKLKGLQSLAQMYSATDNQTAFNELVANAEKEIISHPEVQLQLGFIFQGKHQYQQAIEAFEQTITNIQRIADFKKQQLVYFQALYQLGKSYDEAKTSPEKGIKALTQYIEQAPDRPKKLASKDWAQYRLANLYQQLGNKTQAQSLYQKVFATTTNNELKEKVKKLI
jgi:tetratricopeptide (TPR) repeat protein